MGSLEHLHGKIISSPVTISKVASQLSGSSTKPSLNGKSNISSAPSLFTAKDNFIPLELLMSYCDKKLSSTCWLRK